MSELKPCPFCGGTDLDIRGNGIGDFFVVCGKEPEQGCGASTSDFRCEEPSGAVRRWNTRPEVTELVEALRSARQAFDSIRGAVESNQVVDKDVHGLAIARRNECDAILSKHSNKDR